MSIEAGFESFLKDFVELRLQSMNVRDAGCAWGHPFGLLFFEFEEIEIETAVRNSFGAGESFFGNGKEGKSRWESERFLRAGQQDVNAERVHLDLHGGEGRDGVNDERDIRIFREHGANFWQQIHHAGRGLVVNQCDGVELAGG